MDQFAEIHDGKRNKVRLWKNDERITIVALVLPADMTKTDFPEQTYVDIPRHLLKDVYDALAKEIQ